MIDFTGISKTYRIGDEAVPVLQDVNLHIGAGEFVALLDPSGSGEPRGASESDRRAALRVSS